MSSPPSLSAVSYGGPPMHPNNPGLDIFTKLFLLLLFLSLFIRVCYVYITLRRDQGDNDNLNNSTTPMMHNDQNNNLTGLPFSFIKSYHTFPYSRTNSVAAMWDHETTCAICIEDYQESEMLRMMPQCRHYFHRDCVDSWLKVNATCPVCRNSLKETTSYNNDNNVYNNGGSALERV